MRQPGAEAFGDAGVRRDRREPGSLFAESRGVADLDALRSMAGMGGPRADGGLAGMLPPRRVAPAPGFHDGAEWDGGRRPPPRRSPPVGEAGAPLREPLDAPPAGTGLDANVLALLQGQAALLAHLAGGQAHPATTAPPGFLSTSLPNDPLKAGVGVKGIEALEQLRQDFESRPRAFSEAIRGNAAQPMREPGAPDRGAVMTHFCSRWLPFGTQGGKDKVYLTYGICHALDLMHLGQWELAEGFLHLLVASVEAVCWDRGR